MLNRQHISQGDGPRPLGQSGDLPLTMPGEVARGIWRPGDGFSMTE